MPKQLVEVIDRKGHVVHRYTVELEHEDCFEAEYEEVALILAEKGAVVSEAEHIHLRARCVK
jgi:thiamine biosynthesis protein ThiC